MMADVNSGLVTRLIGAARLGLVIVCTVAAACCGPAAVGAVRHQYLFNAGNANDSVGMAHGTLQNGATVSLGQLNLSGAGQYVNLPAASIAINTFPAVTFEAWYTQNGGGVWQRIFDFGNTGGNGIAAGNGNNYVFYAPNSGGGDARVAISNTGTVNAAVVNSEAIANTTGTPPLTRQYHVAATLDGTAVSLYLNGALVETALYTTAPQTATLGAPSISQLDNTLAYLGRSLYAADPFFNGQINQFTIHDTALSANDIQTRFAAGPTGGRIPTLQINRDTGAMTLLSDQTGVNVVAYTITSNAGSFSPAGWRPITNFSDADSGGSFDNNDNWTVLSATGSEVDLSEAEFDGGMGGALGTGGTTSLQLSTGGLWRKSIYEDVQIQVRLADGSALPVALEYIGNNNQAYRRSDFNFDGQINIADWSTFLANNGTNMSTLTQAESYVLGDLNGDLMSNYTDFRLFKADYNAANGAGAFEALAGAPEPSTIALLFLGFAATGRRGFRRA